MKSIFVGNLDFAATDSSVRALFELYGTVDRVNLVTDRDTGRSRGFAFVAMSDSHQADQAIRGLNGANFEGLALIVNEARPKPAGGVGGRGFSGWGIRAPAPRTALVGTIWKCSRGPCSESAAHSHCASNGGTVETFKKREGNATVGTPKG